MAIASRLTLEEFLSLPETKPASEFVDGEVVEKVAPDFIQSGLQYRLAKSLDVRTGEEPAGYILPELRCVIGGRSYVPDLSYVRAERVPRDEQGRMLHGTLMGAPNVAIEILSPGQRVNLLIEKLHFFVDDGCQAGVLVDPFDQTVGVVRPGAPFQRLRAGDVLRLPEISEDLAIEVAELFADLSP